VEAERLTSLDDEQLVSSHIVRVDVKLGHLAIKLVGPEKQSETQKRLRTLDRQGNNDQDQTPDYREHGHPDTNVLVVLWKEKPLKRPRAIIPACPCRKSDSVGNRLRIGRSCVGCPISAG